MNQQSELQSLPRHIGLFGAILLVIGNVIGSGIFFVGSKVAANTGTEAMFMGAWILGGILSLLGALIYAELGAMFPQSGGLYVFLREAFGRTIGFLFGWACLLVVLTGQAASIAIGFAKSIGHLFPALDVDNVLFVAGPYSLSAGQLLATAIILLIGIVNYRGVKMGSLISAVLTAIKVVGLFLLPLLLLVQFADIQPAIQHAPQPVVGLLPFSVAMIAVLYAYEGWHYAAFAAGEIKDPARTIPRAMLAGTFILIAIYCAVNWTYLLVLGFEGVRDAERVGEAAGGVLAGSFGSLAMTWITALSTLGCTAATFFVSTRVFYAMANDGLFFAKVAELHPRYGSPHMAVMLMTIWSMILTLTGSYEALITYATFSAQLFAILGAVAVIIFRKKRPEAERPYRCWGYPVTPVLFITALTVLLISTAIETPWESLFGLALIAAGIPIGWVWLKGQKNSTLI